MSRVSLYRHLPHLPLVKPSLLPPLTTFLVSAVMNLTLKDSSYKWAHKAFRLMFPGYFTECVFIWWAALMFNLPGPPLSGLYKIPTLPYTHMLSCFLFLHFYRHLGCFHVFHIMIIVAINIAHTCLQHTEMIVVLYLGNMNTTTGHTLFCFHYFSSLFSSPWKINIFRSS